jgi:hypothetical protein
VRTTRGYVGKRVGLGKIAIIAVASVSAITVISALLSVKSQLDCIPLSRCLADQFSTAIDSGSDPGDQWTIFCLVCSFGTDSFDSELPCLLNSLDSVRLIHSDNFSSIPKLTLACPVLDWADSSVNEIAHICAQGLGEVELLFRAREFDQGSISSCLVTASEKLLLNARHSPGARTSRFCILWDASIFGDSRLTSPSAALVELLRDIGCLVDLSHPDNGCTFQPKPLNSIYTVAHYPPVPRPYNCPSYVAANELPSGYLYVVDGPLDVVWNPRNGELLPRVVTGRIEAGDCPTHNDVSSWCDAGIHVTGRPGWIFVKLILETGANSQDVIESLDCVFSACGSLFGNGSDSGVIFATAREMYNIVRAAEAGKNGSAAEYRDYLIPPYYAAD